MVKVVLTGNCSFNYTEAIFTTIHDQRVFDHVYSLAIPWTSHQNIPHFWRQVSINILLIDNIPFKTDFRETR